MRQQPVNLKRLNSVLYEDSRFALDWTKLADKALSEKEEVGLDLKTLLGVYREAIKRVHNLSKFAERIVKDAKAEAKRIREEAIRDLRSRKLECVSKNEEAKLAELRKNIYELSLKRDRLSYVAEAVDRAERDLSRAIARSDRFKKWSEIGMPSSPENAKIQFIKDNVRRLKDNIRKWISDHRFVCGAIELIVSPELLPLLDGEDWGSWRGDRPHVSLSASDAIRVGTALVRIRQ